jgi:hypothetical protein
MTDELRPAGDADDVEGHKRVFDAEAVGEEQAATDDVEGHGTKYRLDDDDVEGHGTKYKLDDDDVEGHGTKYK